MERKLKVIILRNEGEHDHLSWMRACDENSAKVEYRVVNLASGKWLEDIGESDCDVLLAKPGGITSIFKQLYDERIFILDSIGYKIYPSPLEIYLYENKRFLAYWLKANNINHPSTSIIYDLNESKELIDRIAFPIVAKTNIGASGRGVYILKSKKEASRYIKDCFSYKGAAHSIGPNMKKRNYLKRALHYIYNPEDIKKRMNIYNEIARNPQTGFLIFQEYVKHDFEWRAVRIGDSFFAHKKLKAGEKSSGSLLKNYDNPPLKLFDFVKAITDKHCMYSQAIDIFENGETFLVNEMQCIFGQSDPYQMLKDGKPGRYIYSGTEWLFEGGDFARNACYDLRIKYLINKYTPTLV